MTSDKQLNTPKDRTLLENFLFWSIVICIMPLLIHKGLGVTADDILRFVGATNRAGLLTAKHKEAITLLDEQGEIAYEIYALQDKIPWGEGACERATANQIITTDDFLCSLYTAVGGTTHYSNLIKRLERENENLEDEILIIDIKIDMIERADWQELLRETEKYE